MGNGLYVFWCFIELFTIIVSEGLYFFKRSPWAFLGFPVGVCDSGLSGIAFYGIRIGWVCSFDGGVQFCNICGLGLEVWLSCWFARFKVGEFLCFSFPAYIAGCFNAFVDRMLDLLVFLAICSFLE